MHLVVTKKFFSLSALLLLAGVKNHAVADKIDEQAWINKVAKFMNDLPAIEASLLEVEVLIDEAIDFARNGRQAGCDKCCVDIKELRQSANWRVRDIRRLFHMHNQRKDETNDGEDPDWWANGGRPGPDGNGNGRGNGDDNDGSKCVSVPGTPCPDNNKNGDNNCVSVPGTPCPDDNNKGDNNGDKNGGNSDGNPWGYSGQFNAIEPNHVYKKGCLGYKVFATPMTAVNAKYKCEDEGMTIAEWHSVDEFNFLLNMVLIEHRIELGWWASATVVKQASPSTYTPAIRSKFLMSNGETIPAMYWNKAEPNGYDLELGIYLGAEGNYRGELFDWDATAKSHADVMCEKRTCDDAIRTVDDGRLGRALLMTEIDSDHITRDGCVGYKIFDNPVNWFEAYFKCIDEGMAMGEWHTDEQFEFVKNDVITSSYYDGNYWISPYATKDVTAFTKSTADRTKYTWANGDYIPAIYWGAPEPNGFDKDTAIYLHGSKGQIFDDNANYGNYRVLCEVRAC